MPVYPGAPERRDRTTSSGRARRGHIGTTGHVRSVHGVSVVAKGPDGTGVAKGGEGDRGAVMLGQGEAGDPFGALALPS